MNLPSPPPRIGNTITYLLEADYSHVYEIFAGKNGNGTTPAPLIILYADCMSIKEIVLVVPHSCLDIIPCSYSRLRNAKASLFRARICKILKLLQEMK